MPIYPMFTSGGMTAAEAGLHDIWRSLWEQHVAWTRMTIIAAAHNLPSLPQTSARLLRNAMGMGAALQPYYGPTLGTGFAKLIRGHLLIAIDLVSAAKSGDTAAAAAAEKAWYANADDISLFLAGINPYWPQQAVRDMFQTHLALTKQEAVQELTGEYQKSIDTYDEIERQALGMADAVSGGIYRQFGL